MIIFVIPKKDTMQKITKIIFFGALLMVSGWAKSQSLSVPGGQFTVQGVVSDARLEAHLEIENTNNSDLMVLVECDNSQVVFGHQTYYCWALCYDTTVCDLDPTTLDPLIVAGRSIDLNSFHSYIYPNGIAGSSTITYTFFDMNNPTDMASADITFDVLTSGVNELSKGSLSSASPNPANAFTNINYKVPALKDGRLVIYNMLGTVVKEYNLTNAQSTMVLSTSDLSSGVYVYTLMNNGKPVSTKKLVIAHN